MSDLGGERKALQADYDKTSGDIQKRLQTEQAAASTMQPPKLDKVPDKFEHKGMSPKELNDSMTTLFTLAALGGAMTRAPMTAALNAFSAGIKGLSQGDHEVFQRESEMFDRNFKIAIAKNKEAMDEYRLAFEKHRGNISDLMNEWQILAKKHGDTVSAVNMERQDIQGMLRQIEAMSRMDANAERTRQMFQMQQQRIDAMESARQMRGWSFMVDPKTNELVRVNAGTGQVEHIQGSAGLQKPGAKGGSANVRSALVQGAAANALNRLNEIRAIAKEKGSFPTVSLIFGEQPEGITGRIGNAAYRKMQSEDQQQMDALYGSMIDEAIPVFTGGLRGSDAFRRFLISQMPQTGDSDSTVGEKWRVFEANVQGMSHKFADIYKSSPNNWGPGVTAQEVTGGGAAPGSSPGGEAPLTPEEEEELRVLRAKHGR